MALITFRLVLIQHKSLKQMLHGIQVNGVMLHKKRLLFRLLSKHLTVPHSVQVAIQCQSTLHFQMSHLDLHLKIVQLHQSTLLTTILPNWQVSSQVYLFQCCQPYLVPLWFVVVTKRVRSMNHQMDTILIEEILKSVSGLRSMNNFDYLLTFPQ